MCQRMQFYIIHVMVQTKKCYFDFFYMYTYRYVISTFWVRGICRALCARVLYNNKISYGAEEINFNIGLHLDPMNCACLLIFSMQLFSYDTFGEKTVQLP